MRILIADDSLVSRRMLQAFLLKWGYDVVSVEDGDAAWKTHCRRAAHSAP